MSRKRLLLFVLGLFTVGLLWGTNSVIAVLDRTVSNVTLRTLPCTVDSYVKYPNEGGVNVSGHDTLIMEDHEYNLTTRINADDYAAIVVRNARLTLSPLDYTGFSLVLNGRSSLSVINSTISYARLPSGDCQILIQDEAEANFIATTVTGWGYVTGSNTSAVYVNNSNVGNGAAGLQ